MTPNFQDPALIENPFPFYEHLRTLNAPLWHDQTHSWLMGTYASAKFWLSRSDLISAKRTNAVFDSLSQEDKVHAYPAISLFRHWPLFQDRPVHTKSRALFGDAFRSEKLLEPTVVKTVDRIISGLVGRTNWDVVADLATPVPLQVIAGILGVPPEHLPQLGVWSKQLATFLASSKLPMEELQGILQGIQNLHSYFKRLITERKEAPKQDLISEVLRRSATGEHSDDDIAGICSMLLFGGHETTTHLIGNAIYIFLKNPGIWEVLVGASDSTLSTAIEEILRFESPVQYVNRELMADSEYQGRRMLKGQKVSILLGAANRDTTVFQDPEKLDIRRSPNAHLAFAVGDHFCAGASLARLEAKVTLRTVMKVFPRLVLDPVKRQRRKQLGFRGFESLGVRVR